MMLMTNKHLFIVLGVLFLISLGSFVYSNHVTTESVPPEAAHISAGNPSFDELLKRFRTIADDKGGVYAFTVLRHAVLAPGTDMHLIGHEIGNELYKQQGVEGMSGCTHEFRNACSHSIVIGYMQEHGDGADARAAIDAACKKAPGGAGAYQMCYHGLGHGVFAYYGYTLPKTVAFCEAVGTPEAFNVQRDECIGGAIMELIGGGGHDPEKWKEANATYFKKNDPLAPCSSAVIPKYAKPICYVYLTPHLVEWAGASFQRFTPEQMAKAMGACAVLPKNSDLHRSCIGGFGKEFSTGVVGQNDSRLLTLGTFTDAQLKEVERLCLLAGDPDGAHTCESVAVSTFFWGGEAEAHLAPRFCAALSDEASRTFCFDDLAHRVAATIRNPDVRAARCELIPDEHRALCNAPPQPEDSQDSER